jgi:predicted MFS family arabinose efflux permease
MTAGGTLGSYTSGYFKTKLGIRKFLTVVYICLLLLEFLYAEINLDNFLFDAVFIALIGYLLFAVYITIQSEPSYYMNPKKLGVGYGVLLGVAWSGSTISVFVFGPMAGTYGPMIYFIVSMILGVVVFILIQFLPMRAQPR